QIMKTNLHWTAIVSSVLMLIASACHKDDNSGNKQLELVFEDSTYQFTGLAKEQNGRLFVNYPRWSPIYQYAVIEAQGTHGKIPYPNEAMNLWQPADPGLDKWVCVQSVYFDDAGTLWILDPAAPMLKTIQGQGAKLVRMNKA